MRFSTILPLHGQKTNKHSLALRVGSLRPSRIGPRRLAVRLIILFVGVNLLWRVLRYALAFPIWGDEAFLAMNFLLRDFRGMTEPLEYGQIVPLLFTWAELAAVRLLGYSEWALRLLPFIAGIASVFLFWRLARALLDRYAALLSIAIFAASYYPVRHAAEVKPYAIDLFISLVLTLIGLYVSRRPESVWLWGLMIMIGAVSLWCSYPAVFIAGAVGMFLIWHAWQNRAPGQLLAVILYCVAITASLAALYILYAQPQAQEAPYHWQIPMWQNAWPPVREPWWLPLWFLQIHTGNMFAYPVGAQNGGSVLTFILCALGGWRLWQSRRDLLVLLLGPLPLLFIAAAFYKYPYGTSARISLFMAPAICLLAGLGLSSALRGFIPRREVSKGMGGAVIILFIIAVSGMARDVISPYKKWSDQQNRAAIHWLAEQTRPGDEWVVFNSLVDTDYAPNLSQYGGGGARFRFYVSSLARNDVQWGPNPDLYEPSSGGRVWLIAYRHYQVPFPEEKFSAYLNNLKNRLESPCTIRRFALGHPEEIEIYKFGQSH